jgi:acetylornithine deacetylase/succinyl-diaminopimelate desuccinylase-like protein
MNQQRLWEFVDQTWERSILPELANYIRIPNKSPAFDPAWEKNGYMQQAVQLIFNWCQQQPIKDLHCEILNHPGRTPLIYMEVPGTLDRTILLYGHLDKQPELSGWRDNLGPWSPVFENDKLYGRGGADDGYSTFSALTAIAALQQQNIPHARCVILIEASEESGSFDLPFYLQQLLPRIGEVDLVICLDSGCGNYDQLWNTTSLRGIVVGDLRIEVLRHGIHSGSGSGLAPSPFYILRQLLDRIENLQNGEILLREFYSPIPKQRIEQAKMLANNLGDIVIDKIPFLDGVQAINSDLAELILNTSWRPALSITGLEGLPALTNAGNVSRPNIAVKLSMRVAPNADSHHAAEVLKKTLEATPPYQAKVSFTIDHAEAGWNAPEMSPWLTEATDLASQQYFGKEAGYIGEGGTIPFMGMLGKQFPQAQFLITGVLGPESNAHGPNEFLHIPTGKKVTACVAEVIAKHFQHYQSEN